MKTTDGFDIENGYPIFYYLEDGQSVILKDVATGIDGKMRYVVAPYYEGEAMEASGDGGYHHEICIDYEHEGEKTMVTSLFKNPPTKRLEEDYKDSVKDINKLSLAIGEFKLLESTLRKKWGSLKKSFDNEVEKHKQNEVDFGKMTTQLEELTEKVDEKRQALSELEDGIDCFNTEPTNNDDTIAIRKKDMASLRKIEFKMNCLECGGIDNWDGWDFALEDFYKRYPEG